MLGLDRHGSTRDTLIAVFLDHRVEDAARSALEHGSAAYELVHRDGSARSLQLRFVRNRDAQLWLLIEDVTELRRLQRIRSEFIDNLSHELRTPLTTIRLLTETLLQDLERADVPPRIRERVNKIDVETGHLAQMVNELLDLSRIEGGAAELHFDNVDMRAVVLSALDRLRTFAERQGITLVGGSARILRSAVGQGRCRAARAGAGQPAAQRRQVLARRIDSRGLRSSVGRPGCRRSPRSRVSVSRGLTSTASSNASTRSTSRARRGAAEPAWACRSRATSSRDTAGGSGSKARKGRARPSPSPCRWPDRPRAPGRARARRPLGRGAPDNPRRPALRAAGARTRIAAARPD